MCVCVSLHTSASWRYLVLVTGLQIKWFLDTIFGECSALLLIITLWLSLWHTGSIDWDLSSKKQPFSRFSFFLSESDKNGTVPILATQVLKKRPSAQFLSVKVFLAFYWPLKRITVGMFSLDMFVNWQSSSSVNVLEVVSFEQGKRLQVFLC